MSNGTETKVRSISADLENVDDAEIVSFGQRARVYLICIFVAFGGFLFGYDCVIGGPMIDIERFKLDFGTLQKTGNLGFAEHVRGGFVAVMSLGTFCGALCASEFADRLGRKKGLIATCGVFTIGIIFQIVATGIAVLMVGRYIAGFGVGLVSVMVPLYQAECIPAKRRGTIVSCYQLAITIGLLIGQIALFFCQSKPSKASYKIPIGLQFAWSGILFVGILFFPETPRYLIKMGKWDEAVKAKVRLTGFAPNDPRLQEELLEVKGNLEHELSLGKATYIECWRGLNLRRTLLGVFMQAWQQLTGVNFIFYYGTMFFKSAGIENAFLVQMLMGTVNCAMTFPGLYLVEKIGRRRLLLWGAAFQLISHFLVGIIHTATKGSVPVCTAIFSGTFIAAFAASWGPCAWVLTAELFGLKTRAKQMSFAVAGNWGFNGLLGFVAPLISGDYDNPRLGTNVAFLWGALNVGCWAYVYFFIPELKGLQLEQVDEIFEKKIPARHTAGWRPTVSYKSHELDTFASETGEYKDHSAVSEVEVSK